MKNIFFTILLSFLFFNGFSQGPPSFGIFAGPQASTAAYKVKDAKQETDYRYGAFAGITMKVPFDNQLYFAPALYYSKKGYEVQLKDKAFPPSTLAKNNITSINTLEIAGLLQFDFNKQPGTVFIKAGPAFDFAFAGNEKFDLEDGTTVDQKMKFSFGDYGRYTAQFVTILGYEAKSGFFIFGQYSLGLGSLNNADDGPSIRHRIAGLAIGKYFRSKKVVVNTSNKE